MTTGEPRLESRLRAGSGVLMGFTAEVAEDAEKNQRFCLYFPISFSAHSATSAVNQLNHRPSRPS